ncbi:GT4 family glycosyltransferase PelF [Halobacillus locisalis]|uniref:GT4 family glycosyltransferase PelF n=1 Tax=Halobacillus locisalis TaxID=220753 RepID=A0A838CWH8_9BACI|nr:GT4 family glycosyltransferase PelF [Halobacillus locisalis]MBA2176288.1 GT4 family glycosyltransferase PelF [Halobacillus locisalis]
MKIGMVVEGSYPYVSGGVASWVQMVIQKMPEHEFEIIAITPEDMSPEDYRYALPGNVVGVTNLPLNLKQRASRKQAPLTKEEENNLTEWMMFKEPRSEALDLLGEKLGRSSEFFSSPLFWELVQNSYEEEQQSGSFIEYFYMWQGMFTPVIELLQFDFPEVDLIHSASTGYAGLIASAIKRQQNVPYILTEHGIYSREREEEILQAAWIADYYKKRWVTFFHHLSRQAYREADDVITLFERNSELQAHIGAPEEKLSVIPNGIQYDRLSVVQREEKNSDKLTIGAIVRVVPIKDIKTMIQAARLLADQRIPFDMYIMGPLDEDEEYAEECLHLITQLELTDCVFLVGKVNIIEYLPKFDVCLLTSISEGQPLAVLEGMAAAIPWVVTDVGSCSELIYGREDDPFGPAGFVVPPVNPIQVAQYCEWFYSHPEEAIKFGLNGQKRVEAYYQVHQFIEQYAALYEERREAYGGHRV